MLHLMDRPYQAGGHFWPTSAHAASKACRDRPSSSTRPRSSAALALARMTPAWYGPVHQMQHARDALPAHIHAETDFARGCGVSGYDAKIQRYRQRDAAADAKPSMAPMLICSISCQARLNRGPSLRCRRNEPISMVLPTGLRILQVETSAESLAAGEHHDRRFAVVLKPARGVGELTQRLGDNALMPSPRSKPHHGDTPSTRAPFRSLQKSPPTPALPALLPPMISHSTTIVGSIWLPERRFGAMAVALAFPPLHRRSRNGSRRLEYSHKCPEDPCPVSGRRNDRGPDREPMHFRR